jgi:hypothetical protein
MTYRLVLECVETGKRETIVQARDGEGQWVDTDSQAGIMRFGQYVIWAYRRFREKETA